MGQIFGAAIAMALFGALFGWILRKITPLTLVPSYVVGIIIAVALGSYVYTLGQPGALYADALVVYGVGGIIALPILLVTARRRKPE